MTDFAALDRTPELAAAVRNLLEAAHKRYLVPPITPLTDSDHWEGVSDLLDAADGYGAALEEWLKPYRQALRKEGR